MNLPRSWSLAAALALLLSGCDSKTETVIDTELQARVQTIQDCFPNLYKWFGALLRIVDTWRLRDASASDPAGLTWVPAGGGVDVTFVIESTTTTMQIRFYGPAGALEDLSTAIAGATTLAEVMDLAAGELRTLHGDDEKFIHGVWSMTGGGISAAGEGLTGVLGGTAAQDALAVLYTSDATVGSGLPAADPSTITDGGPPVCSLTFATDGLSLDEEPTQEYPRGVLLVQVDGDRTVTATVTLDKTSTAVVVVDDIPGSFAIDLDTRDLTYRP